jgi:hypothetical protein
MVLHPPPTSVQDWVVDSGATHHTIPPVGNISTLRPLASSNPSSIIIDNDSSFLITSVGDSVLSGPFYLNNILLAPDMVQRLLLFVVSLLTIGALWNLIRLVCL